jgi:hypothetical protein
MSPRTQNRKAISTVLTTLIILVASVVLGTGVVLYGTSLFQTSAQSSAISVTGTQVWVDSTGSSGWTWGAADVRNSGDKLLSVDKISIRGVDVPFANWYADKNTTQVTNTNFQSALIYTSMIVSPNSLDGQLKNGTATTPPTPLIGSSCPYGTGNMIIQLTSTNPTLCLTKQSGPVSLAPGEKVIVYFKIPQNVLTSVDAGGSSSVSIYAGQVGSPTTITIASK